MISRIFPDLLDSIELFEEDEECERVREGHGRKRDSFIDRRGENRFIYSICTSDEKNDIGVGYFGFFHHFRERFRGYYLGTYITVHDHAFLLL